MSQSEDAYRHASEALMVAAHQSELRLPRPETERGVRRAKLRFAMDEVMKLADAHGFQTTTTDDGPWTQYRVRIGMRDWLVISIGDGGVLRSWLQIGQRDEEADLGLELNWDGVQKTWVGRRLQAAELEYRQFAVLRRTALEEISDGLSRYIVAYSRAS